MREPNWSERDYIPHQHPARATDRVVNVLLGGGSAPLCLIRRFRRKPLGEFGQFGYNLAGWNGSTGRYVARGGGEGHQQVICSARSMEPIAP